MSPGLSSLPDGRVLCCYNISNDCKGYITVEQCFTFPGDKQPSDVCQPCGELDMQRYYTEHYG